MGQMINREELLESGYIQMQDVTMCKDCIYRDKEFADVCGGVFCEWLQTFIDDEFFFCSEGRPICSDY